MKIKTILKIFIYLIFTALFFTPFYITNKINKAEENKKRQQIELSDYIKKKKADLENMVFIDTIPSFYIDRYEFPNKEGEIPLSGLDYYSAKKVCELSGKRLCTKQEWESACKGKEGKRYYPFAEEYRQFDQNRCNNLHQKRKIAFSGSFPNCRTDEGVFDLAGNLWEWVETNDEKVFIAKGGSYLDGEISERCHTQYVIFSFQMSKIDFSNFGTRCCY